MASTPFGDMQMRLVLAVAERGNLSRAAADLGVSQPAASQQLSGLEAALGRRLFRREPRNLVLTSDGEAYLIYARAMVKIGDAARRHFETPPGPGAIRLGLTEDLARTVLPVVLVMFARDYPDFEFIVTCGSSAALFAGLDEKRHDIVVAKRRPDRVGCEILWSEPLAWFGGEATTLPVPDPIDLVMVPDPSETRDAVLRALRDGGRTWRVLFQSTSLATLEAVVTAGVGISACGRNLRGPGLVELGEDARLPAIDPVDVVLEHAAGGIPDAVEAFSRLVREAAMMIGRLPLRQA